VADAAHTGHRLGTPTGAGGVREVWGAMAACGEGRREATVAAGGRRRRAGQAALGVMCGR